MHRLTTLSALARVGAALAEDSDTASVLTLVVQGCARVFEAEAVGIVAAHDLVAPDPHALELLAASSHTAGALELYQIQAGHGPCVDAIVDGTEVDVVGRGGLLERWPEMADATSASEMGAVHALPLRWDGTTFGALNVFLRDERSLGDRRTELRAFADLATVAIVHGASRPSLDDVGRAIAATLAGGALLEQAKGVLRVLRGVDGGAAFELLVDEAARRGAPVTAVAEELVDAASRGERPSWALAEPR